MASLRRNGGRGKGDTFWRRGAASCTFMMMNNGSIISTEVKGRERIMNLCIFPKERGNHGYGQRD